MLTSVSQLGIHWQVRLLPPDRPCLVCPFNCSLILLFWKELCFHILSSCEIGPETTGCSGWLVLAVVQRHLSFLCCQQAGSGPDGPPWLVKTEPEQEQKVLNWSRRCCRWRQ